MTRFSLCLFVAFLASPLQAQQPSYQPSYKLPEGRQYVLVYLGNTYCKPCADPELRAAVRDAKSLLAAQAKSAVVSFAAIAVVMDWELKEGLSFLEPLGLWDEVMIGANWASLGAQRYIWEPAVQPSIPQVVVLERDFDQSPTGLLPGPDKVLRRFTGAADLVSWVKNGAPLRGR